jgi:hypothetical protein
VPGGKIAFADSSPRRRYRRPSRLAALFSVSRSCHACVRTETTRCRRNVDICGLDVVIAMAGSDRRRQAGGGIAEWTATHT